MNATELLGLGYKNRVQDTSQTVSRDPIISSARIIWRESLLQEDPLQEHCHRA